MTGQIGLANLELRTLELKTQIMERQRQIDLITEFVRKHPKCSLEYSDLFIVCVEDTDFCYDEVIQEIGVDRWLS